MNDLITRITNAIFRQEGEGPTARNPGNLRDCPWFPKDLKGRYYPEPAGPIPAPYVAYANGFWVPRSRAEGVAGAAHVVALHIAEGDSLRGLIAGRPGYQGFSPKEDGNDTEAYIKNVAAWANIPNVDLPLWNWILDETVS